MAAQRVIVIGGGSTGCATAHDLALRGFQVVLIERSDLAAGTTGRCSCYLHSGARYAVKDPEAAIECIEENETIRRIVPARVLEENGGCFLLLDDDDPAYGDAFFDGCAASGIEAREISPRQLFQIEPNVTREVRRVGIIPDAVVEPLRYVMSFAATAQVHGARILRHTEVKEIVLAGSRVTGVRVLDRVSQELYPIEADLVVNAAGPWVDRIAQMVGIRIPISISPGVHAIVGVRLVNMTLNRMRVPASADWVAPLRNQSITGTSSWTVEDCDFIFPRRDHVEAMIAGGELLVPVMRKYPVIAINAAARPLIAAGGARERDLSRTFTAFDHAARDQVDGFVTIAGGKLCTARAMAEKIGDVVCQKLGVDAPCQTRTAPLVSYRRLYAG
jgi:glycerol-3-phosphate dehydrogenase